MAKSNETRLKYCINNFFHRKSVFSFTIDFKFKFVPVKKKIPLERINSLAYISLYKLQLHTNYKFLQRMHLIFSTTGLLKNPTLRNVIPFYKYVTVAVLEKEKKNNAQTDISLYVTT